MEYPASGSERSSSSIPGNGTASEHDVGYCPAARVYIDDILAATGREGLTGANSIHEKQSPEFIHKYY